MKTYLFIFEVIMGTISVVLTIYWYDWKLFIILTLYGWYLNLSNNRYRKGE